MTMKSFEDVFEIYYSAADYDPTFKFFTAQYHKIRTWSSQSPGFHNQPKPSNSQKSNPNPV